MALSFRMSKIILTFRSIKVWKAALSLLLLLSLLFQAYPIVFSASGDPPIQSNPYIESSSGTNTTLEDIICYNQSTSDPDLDPVNNVYNWYVDGVSFTYLNLPFDVNNATNSKDYSPYGNDGVLKGGVIWTSEGVVGGAYDFDGVDDYVEVPDSVYIDGNGAWSEISIEFWLNLNSFQRDKEIISKSGSYVVGLHSSVLKDENTLFWRLGDKEVEYETPLEPNVWYHIVVTYRSTSGLVIYVNGSTVLTRRNYGSHSGDVPDTSTAFGIGGDPNTISQCIDGTIDGVRIYSARLSTIQIAKLYNESRLGLSNSSTIVSHQTTEGEIWECEVTPNDGTQDGTTLGSDSLTVLPGPEYMTYKWEAWTSRSTGRGVLVADIIGDEREEIIHTGMEGNLTVYNGTSGAKIYEVNYMPDGIPGLDWYAQAQMADLDQDGTLEIIVPLCGPYHDVGIMVLNSEDGSQVWNTTGAWGELTAAPVVGDIDGDGYPTIFVGTSDVYTKPTSSYKSKVVAMSHTGEILWTTPVWRLCAGGLALADTNHDGFFELYGGDRSMYYGDGGFGRGLISWWADNGTIRWFEPEILMSSNMPMIVDVDKDGILDVVGVELRGGLVVLNSTNGYPLRKDLELRQLGGHYQAAVYDLDQDGNIEVLLSDGDHSSTTDDVTVWDLYEWKEDFRVWVGESFYGPKAGDVDGDGNLDMIVCTTDGIYVFDDEFKLIASYEGLRPDLTYVTVQDVDGDGFNDIVAPTSGSKIYVFNTSAPRPTPRARTEVQLGSEKRQGAYEFIPYTEVAAPVVSNPSPGDEFNDVLNSVSELSFNLIDYQADLMDYHVSIYPDIISGSSSATGVVKGTYSVPLSGAQYSTEYAWWVNVTDGENWSNNSYSFRTIKDGWWKSDWAFKKSVTINHSQVGALQYDFPVLVDISDPDLADKAQPDGDDIAFTSEWGVKLAHEIEMYDSGHLIAWVKVPALNPASDVVLYMYYGNPTANNQESPEGVWSTDYSMVQHFEEAEGTAYDSTGYVNDGVTFGGAIQDVPGRINGAVEFDGSSGNIVVPSSPSISGFTDALTVSAWVKPDTLATRQCIVCKFDTVGNQRGWYVEFDNASDTLKFRASPDGVNNYVWSIDDPFASLGWHHVAVVWESNLVPSFYINGSLVTTNGGATIASIYDNPGAPLYIGRSVFPGRYVDGRIDELRIENFNRTAEFFETLYNNVMGSGFLIIGVESVIDGAPITYGVEPDHEEMDVFSSIDSLNFTIYDDDGDTMDWYVSTSPDIGSDSGSGTDGTYSVAVSGLLPEASYTWTVDVFDGSEWTNNTFSFETRRDNYAPTHGTPLIESALGFNTTVEDLTVYNQTTVDLDDDSVTNIYNWLKDGESITVLNLPFDTNSSTTALDYSGTSNHARIFGASWTPDGLVGGAYEFDGVDDFIVTPDTDNSLDGNNDREAITLESWIRLNYNQLEDPYFLAKRDSYAMRIDYRSSWAANVLEVGFWESWGKTYYEVSYEEPLEVGAWTHAVVTYQTGEHSQIYINGTAVPTTIGRDLVYTIMTDDNKTLTLRIRARGWTVLVDGLDIRDSDVWPGGRRVTGPFVTLEAVPEAWGLNDYGPVLNVYDKFGAWEFTGWTGNHTGTENPLVLNVNTNTSVIAEFVPASSIHNSGSNLDLGRYAGSGDFRYFNGSLDGVRIYPYKLTPEQVLQLYQDSKGGLSDSSTIVAEETEIGDDWSCQVTPSDGKIDGTSIITNSLTILESSFNELYSVVRSLTDGISYNAWSESGSWDGWTALPGATLMRPAASVLNNKLHIVVKGTSGRLYHGYIDVITEDFSGWTKISGDTPSAPVLTSSADTIYLVVRGNNDCIYYRSWNGTWDDWNVLPGSTIESPAATIVGSDLHLVVKGVNSKLYHGVLDTTTNGFSGWTSISGATPSAPVLTDNESSVYLVVRGNNDKIYYREWETIWGDWIVLPGMTEYSVGAAVSSTNIHLKVIGKNGKLYFGTVDLSTFAFSGWNWVSGSTLSAPTLATN